MMTLDGTTLLIVALIFTGFSCFVWLLSAFLFKSSPKISVNFALANFFLGMFMLFYVLRGVWPTLSIYVMSDITVILGCLLLRRATQEFTDKEKTDLELAVLFFASTLIDIYIRITGHHFYGVLMVCSVSLYLVVHAFINSYGYMIKNFAKVYSITTTAPLLLMGSVLAVRIVTSLFQSGSPDLRQQGAFNTGFLVVMMVSIIGFNATAIGLVVSKMITQIKRLSQEDPLTKIFNRRHLNTVAEIEINKVRKNNSTLSIVLLDIDHFKKVNDVYGHAAGDVALITCVEVIKKSIRSTDYVGRLGGEEFCILLPNTNLEDAKVLSNRIRENIAAHHIVWEEHTIPITASFGITSFNSSGQNEWSNLLNKADIAMYQAKNNGRNQVVLN
jgi:diguanylate cyclase (GGDEF)-like protein